MKMASKSIDLISKKTNCTCSTLFFLISKKNKFARAARFLSFFVGKLNENEFSCKILSRYFSFKTEY